MGIRVFGELKDFDDLGIEGFGNLVLRGWGIGELGIGLGLG